jgi:hypothetical protein
VLLLDRLCVCDGDGSRCCGCCGGICLWLSMVMAHPFLLVSIILILCPIKRNQTTALFHRPSSLLPTSTTMPAWCDPAWCVSVSVSVPTAATSNSFKIALQVYGCTWPTTVYLSLLTCHRRVFAWRRRRSPRSSTWSWQRTLVLGCAFVYPLPQLRPGQQRL